MPRIGVSQNGVGWGYTQMRDFWVEADRLGFHSGWMMDNTVWPSDVSEEGSAFQASGEAVEMMPVFETWTVLPALAEATKQIRMGPLVTPCNRRHPALFAKITSVFDRISNGRLNLGLGPGDDPIYYEPWGIRYPEVRERIAILREEIEVLKRLWTEKEANFDGAYYTLRNATNDPKPVQKPHPPIWLGIIFGKQLMPRLAAEHADGVNLYNASDRAVKEILGIFEERCQEVGRDFDAVLKSRSVNVVFSESPDVLPPLETLGGTTVGLAGERFRELLGMPEELANFHDLTISEQRSRLSSAKQDYLRITERFVFGTPDQIAEELTRMAEDGIDEFIIRGLDSIELLRRFAADVMPSLWTPPHLRTPPHPVG